MKHNLTVFSSLATLLLCGALVVGCDDDEGTDVVLPDGQVVFTDLDLDGDGLIDEEEYDDFYDNLDRDGDGVIEDDEWLFGADFDTIDVDGNGELDQQEYEDAFDELDDDHDGDLDANDLF